ncbi:hypothetical protein Tco_0732114 [Tanacetum coccineum]
MSQPANDEFSQHLSDDETSNHEDASDTGAAPKQQQQNGNSKKRILTRKDGVVRILPPVSPAEIHAVEKERKARTILLMAIPKEHLRRFHGMDDAKEIWEAIRTRFGGNANSKKMQEAVLKQQFKRDSFYQDQEAGKQEKNQMGLLTMDDGIVNWGEHTEDEETNHALMAISSGSELEKLKKYRRIGMKAVKEKEQLQKTLDSWKDSSKNLWRLINSGMSSNSKTGLGYEIKSNNEVLSYEEEMNFSVFKGTEEDSVRKPLYSRFIKANDFKGPQEPEPSVSDDRSSEYSTYQSNDSEGSIGTSFEHSVDPESEISRVPQEVYVSKPITTNEKGVSAPKSKEVAKPVWTNANKVNHANQFVPRSIQLNAGRPNINSVRPNINTGRTNINFVRPNINTGRVNVNSVKSNVNTGRTNVNPVRPRVNTVNSNVNTVRSRQLVLNRTSNSFSPKKPQVNQLNQRRHFSKSHSPMSRPIVRNTARMTYSHAVKGNWGSAVKTSAELAIPGQTATGKESSNPFMAGSLPKTIHFCNSLQSDEDSFKLIELMILCTNFLTMVLDLENTKTSQQSKIASLKRSRSRTHKVKRLYKVGLTARVKVLW